jgi:thiamine biosynthesis protein ThiI
MKFVSLISSGIDSPVATYLLSKKAEEMILVHGDNKPFTDEREIKNFTRLTSHLKNLLSCPIKLYIISHGNSLNIFKQNCTDRYTCIFCKRMLIRYAEKIAENEGAEAIIMGDSLGQVASQTLQNIKVIDQTIKMPILRPLIGFDKENVIRIAKEIGTYDFSILPSESCKAVPKKPATRAKLENVLDEENKIDIDNLVKEALDNSELLFL